MQNQPHCNQAVRFASDLGLVSLPQKGARCSTSSRRSPCRDSFHKIKQNAQPLAPTIFANTTEIIKSRAAFMVFLPGRGDPPKLECELIFTHIQAKCPTQGSLSLRQPTIKNHKKPCGFHCIPRPPAVRGKGRAKEGMGKV